MFLKSKIKNIKNQILEIIKPGFIYEFSLIDGNWNVFMTFKVNYWDEKKTPKIKEFGAFSDEATHLRFSQKDSDGNVEYKQIKMKKL